MKKLFKRTSALLLLFCLVLCTAALAACGEDPVPEGQTNYSVTVTLPDGTPVEGARVTWKKNSTYGPVITDANGVASIRLPSDEYTVTLSMLPGEYFAEDATVNASSPEIELVLKPESERKIEYTVKVVYANGDAVQGAFVELCILGNAGKCTPFPNVTDENGETVRELAPETYRAKIITGLPDGYDYEKDDDGYYTGAEATAENPSVTITLTAV